MPESGSFHFTYISNNYIYFVTYYLRFAGYKLLNYTLTKIYSFLAKQLLVDVFLILQVSSDKYFRIKSQNVNKIRTKNL